MSKYEHASIAQMEQAQDLSWTEMWEILATRSARAINEEGELTREPTKSEMRAYEWCRAHMEYAPEYMFEQEGQEEPAPAPKPKAQRKTGVGSRGGDPVKAMRAKCADAVAERGKTAWWDAYRETRGESLEELEELYASLVGA